jgi:hypothetical protein
MYRRGLTFDKSIGLKPSSTPEIRAEPQGCVDLDLRTVGLLSEKMCAALLETARMAPKAGRLLLGSELEHHHLELFGDCRGLTEMSEGSFRFVENLEQPTSRTNDRRHQSKVYYFLCPD